MKLNETKKTPNKSLSIFILVAVLLVTSAIAITAIFSSNNVPAEAIIDVVVFTVNDEPVTLRELENSVLHERNNVVASFILAGADFGDANFWNEPINGETPLEVLKETSIQRAARIKVMQIHAMEHGLIDDISYEAFMSAMYEENLRREEMLVEGEVIFGPQEFSESLFFDISVANLEEELRRVLAPELSATEEELREFYASEWQETPAESGWIVIDKLYVPYMPTGYLFRDEALEKMESLMTHVQGGISFVEIAEQYSSAMYTEQFLALRRGEGDIGQRASIQTAINMSIGDISDIYEDLETWAVLKVVDRNEEAFLGFEDLWVIMQRTLAERNFITRIDNLLEEAVININEDAIPAVLDTLGN